MKNRKLKCSDFYERSFVNIPSTEETGSSRSLSLLVGNHVPPRHLVQPLCLLPRTPQTPLSYCQSSRKLKSFGACPSHQTTPRRPSSSAGPPSAHAGSYRPSG